MRKTVYIGTAATSPSRTISALACTKGTLSWTFNPEERKRGDKDSVQEKEGKEKNKVRTTSGFGHGT